MLSWGPLEILLGNTWGTFGGPLGNVLGPADIAESTPWLLFRVPCSGPRNCKFNGFGIVVNQCILQLQMAVPETQLKVRCEWRIDLEELF